MSTKIVFAASVLTILFLVSDISFGQKCKIKSQSKVSVDVFPNSTGISEDESTFVNTLKKKLSDYHLLASSDEVNLDYNFFIGLKESNSKTEKGSIVTVVIMGKIPKEVVEIGAKGEAFYKVISLEKPLDISEEGRNIREAISAYYMRKFGQIESCSTEEINMKDADIFCDGII